MSHPSTICISSKPIPDHLTCLLRNLYAGQEATVRTGHGTTNWFQIKKEVRQGCILSPCVFNLYAEYIMWNAGLDEAQAEIKIAGRSINNFRYADDTTLMAESEEELKSLLMRVKEESEKAGLKLNIQETKIMASGPITSWQIDGKTMETVTDFIFGGSKITADGDCSHEIKTLAPWKKSYNPTSSVQFSHSVMSDSLRPHELQHARLPCPSPTPRACSNSCPSSQWCHPTISSSFGPFSSRPQSFPASESFPMSQFFSSGGQSIGASASALQMNIQGQFPSGLTDFISFPSKGLSRVFSRTTIRKLKSILQNHNS